MIVAQNVAIIMFISLAHYTLSARIVRLLKSDNNDPEFISQRKAYELFGRRNVERWKQQGKVVSYKRPGKVEYLFRREIGNTTASPTSRAVRAGRIFSKFSTIIFGCLIFNV